MTLARAELERRVDQARGDASADLVIKGARLLNVATGTLDSGDIAVCGAAIVATHGTFRGRREIDASGLIAVPGFVDAHVHIESSLVLPDRFARAVLPRGTTTAIWDPHEIANVCGLEGLRWALAAARALPMTVRVALSSCVPSSPLETSGARLEAADLLTLAGDPGVVGLAELMSFPGVLAKDRGLLDKLAAFAGRHVDGHAPLLSGRALDAYLACGVRTDHECTTLEEGREKQAKGMHLFLREGSLSKDVAALAPLIGESTWPFLAFCTDDRNPIEIVLEGHVDAAIRKAIAAGAPPIATYRAATLGACLAFGLSDRGMLAPGRRADIVLLGDLEACSVVRVIAGGRPVEEALFAGAAATPPVGLSSVRRAGVAAADFRIPQGAATPVIGVREGSLLTDRLDLEVPQAHGLRVADPAGGILKVAVLERHGKNGNIGKGFVAGFGPLRGALATSVGHDSHNLTVVGANDADMAAAADRLIALQGGLVAVEGGRVLAELALPAGGLMTTGSFDEARDGLAGVLAAARGLGTTLAEPFLQMAFLPLPVIPHLKITDMGLVDVDRFALIEG